MKNKTVPKCPDKISSYFKAERAVLSAVTVSGIFYNVGLLAGPWFEGRLAQCLMDIFGEKSTFSDMLKLAVSYVLVIAAVQAARYIKRLYVRRFANNTGRSMKQVLYASLIHHSKRELESENIGSIMTKAISDVDACAEGMRKFTTEVFDTGVALVCYAAMLFFYDWRLALISLVFPPVSYFLAEKMKKTVQQSSAAAQESRGRLSAATLDRVSNAGTYRVFGCEIQRERDYEKHLEDYEKSSVRANVWVAALPPLYQIISMISVVFIIYFGSRNVAGTGFAAWDVAAFTTFLSCFIKLAVKSSKAAKLFNAVQKAEVSWKRIKPLMKPVPEETEPEIAAPAKLEIKDLGMAYPGAEPVFEGLSFSAEPGQIIGVTGPVACGKSTLGRAFLCEYPYMGSIRFGGRELSSLSKSELSGTVGYMGHDPELLSESIKNNILWGDEGAAAEFLKAVYLDEEAAAMPKGDETLVGSGGVRLSGGQQARLALARTLAHPRPVMVLDDPFSALDRDTEEKVFENLRALSKNSVVLLISHRLYLFPSLDGVIWMENGGADFSTHGELMKNSKTYAALYDLQKGGERNEK